MKGCENMKWNTQGSQFYTLKDALYDEYKQKKIYIYGAGQLGKRIATALRTITDWDIVAFVDQYKAGTEYLGLQVISMVALEEIIKEEKEDLLILLALQDENEKELSQTFEKLLAGTSNIFKCYSEFMRHDFPIIAYYQYGKVVIHSLSCIVTEICTLKCEKCAINLPFFKYRNDYSEEKIKEEIDLAFKKIDFVCDFTFTGGEPLLNNNLSEILLYISKNYSNRMGSCRIITNGTLTPTQELLDCMSKYHVYAEISDYTKSVKEIKQRVLSNYEKFKVAGVSTYLLSNNQWVDFGLKKMIHKNKTEEEMIRFFDDCRTICRGYINGKIWYCINARFAEQALEMKYDSNNMFDLKKMGNEEVERIRLIEFDMGYNERGYLTMCRYCNGGCSINEHYVEVGKQLKKVL